MISGKEPGARPSLPEDWLEAGLIPAMYMIVKGRKRVRVNNIRVRVCVCVCVCLYAWIENNVRFCQLEQQQHAEHDKWQRPGA